MKQRMAGAVALVMLVSLAGCGGGDSGNGDEDGTAVSGAPPVSLSGPVTEHGRADVSGKGTTTVKVDLYDFSFGPSYVKVAAGQSLTVELHNEGQARHTFTVPGTGIDQELAPGSRAIVNLSATSGALVYSCRFHQGRGMQGAFYTGADMGAPPSTTATTAATSYGY